MVTLLPSADALARIRQIAECVATAGQQGMILPDGLRSPESVMARILLGAEMGIPPLTAIYSCTMEGDNLAMGSQLKVALARRHGIHITLDAASNDEQAVCHLRRPEWSADESVTITYTLDEARRAKLTDKKNWVKYPRDMLAQRCMARAVNLYGQDACVGLAYTFDELGLETNEQGDSLPYADRISSAPDHPVSYTTVDSADCDTRTGSTISGDAPIGSGADNPTGGAPPPDTPTSLHPDGPAGDHNNADTAESDSLGETADRPAVSASSIKARIMALIREAGYTQQQWRDYTNLCWGVASIDDCTERDRQSIVAHLETLGRIRRIRNILGVNDAAWDKIISRREATHELLVSSAELNNIEQKLLDRMTPSDRARLDGESAPPTTGSPSQDSSGAAGRGRKADDSQSAAGKS